MAITIPEKPTSEAIDENGGRPSNRPPVIVDPDILSCLCAILASGIDTICLSLTLGWSSNFIFEYLSALKEKAQHLNEMVDGVLFSENGRDPLKFLIMPHGIRSYTWLLSAKDYFIKIFNSLEPTQRPGVTVEIRSEALWANGAIHAIEYILDILEGMGAIIHEIKVSRIDLCVDVLMDSKLWNPSLKDYTSTTAKLKHIWDYGFDFTGLTIGSGHIIARLYDKVREITQKSKKYWMFDIWGIKEEDLPEDKRIIRIEFQLKREVIKSLINCDVFNTLEYLDRIWGYCTQSWLKFQDNPGEHHSKRNTFPWWETIQNGFQGIQNPKPFVRKQSISQNKRQLCAQINGLLTSLQAIIFEEKRVGENEPSDLYTVLKSYKQTLIEMEDKKASDPEIITKITQKKRSRYQNTK